MRVLTRTGFSSYNGCGKGANVKRMQRGILLAMALLGGALSVLPQAAVAADNLPSRKPGLWKVSLSNLPGFVQHCVDAATERLFMEAAFSDWRDLGCKAPAIRRVGKHAVADSICPKGQTLRVESSGDLTSDYTITAKSSATAGPDATHHGVWLGPCKSGQLPGQIFNENGVLVDDIRSSIEQLRAV